MNNSKLKKLDYYHYHLVTTMTGLNYNGSAKGAKITFTLTKEVSAFATLAMKNNLLEKSNSSSLSLDLTHQ